MTSESDTNLILKNLTHFVVVFIERAVGADTELIEEHGFTLQSHWLMSYWKFLLLNQHLPNLISSQKECSYKAWRKYPYLCLYYSGMKKNTRHRFNFSRKSPTVYIIDIIYTLSTLYIVLPLILTKPHKMGFVIIPFYRWRNRGLKMFAWSRLPVSGEPTLRPKSAWFWSFKPSSDTVWTLKAKCHTKHSGWRGEKGRKQRRKGGREGQTCLTNR